MFNAFISTTRYEKRRKRKDIFLTYSDESVNQEKHFINVYYYKQSCFICQHYYVVQENTSGDKQQILTAKYCFHISTSYVLI